MQKRDSEVLKLICRGLTRETIILYANQNGWPETEPEVDELIELAFAELARQAAAVDVEAEFGRAIVRLNELYTDAKKVQDTRTALSVQKEINKLLSLKLGNAGAGRGTARKEEPKQKLRIVT